jgi:L-ascorbate metabolism protein UlaG (beta-lactamase superfamily)
MKIIRWLLVGALALSGAVLARAYFLRPGMEEYAAHHYVGSPPSGSALTATWFGVTAVLLSDGEHAVMVDPFFTRPEGLLNLLLNRKIAPDETLIKRWLERSGVKHLDAVLVSHSHFDHAMDAGVVARLTGATLLGSESTANIGRGSGLAETQLRVIKPEEDLEYGPFTITFFESRHAGATGGKPTGDVTEPLGTPAHYLDYKLGGAYSILIEHPLGSTLHHGSAGFVPGALAKAMHGRKAEVVFLGVALVDDLDTYLAEVVDAAGATRVVPTHWDDFTRSLEKPLLPMPIVVHLDRFFEQMARRTDLAVQTLQVSEPAVLFSPRPNVGE